MKMSNDPLIENIKNISADSSLLIELKREDPNFIKNLSSHIFSIYNPMDLDDSGGVYKRLKDFHYLSRQKGYLKNLRLIKGSNTNINEIKLKNYDTYLAYTQRFNKDEDI